MVLASSVDVISVITVLLSLLTAIRLCLDEVLIRAAFTVLHSELICSIHLSIKFLEQIIADCQRGKATSTTLILILIRINTIKG